MAGVKHVFTFKVTGTPPTATTFSYDPTSDWTYGGDDTLQFETTAGPFTLDLIRKDAANDPDATRPFGILTSYPEDGKHIATTPITDGLSKAERDNLRIAHQTAQDPFGFIARYRYKIQVTMPGGKAVDDQKNGEYHC